MSQARGKFKILLIWFFGLAIIGGALFYSGVSNPFVLDDVAKIRDNPDLRVSSVGLSSFLFKYSNEHTHFENDPSRPVTYLLYWICWQIGNGSPIPFHILNIFLHVCASFLVGLIAWQLIQQLELAVLCSLLFLVLPIGAGTVLYAYGLSDILSGTLILAVIWIVLVHESVLSVILACILTAAALFTKQSAAVIPALTFLARPKAKRLNLFLVGVVAAYLIWRIYYFHAFGDLEAVSTFSASDYFLAQGCMILKYIWLSIWPSGFAIDHAVSLPDYNIAEKILSWLFIVGVSGTAIWFWIKNKYRPIIWAWLLFLIPLLPTSSLFPTTDLFVERRAYLSIAGLTLLLCGALSFLKITKMRLAEAAFSCTAAALFFVSLSRVPVYASEEKLFSEALSIYPNDLRSKGNLATAYLNEKEYHKAKDVLEQILQVDPKDLLALSNLGVLYQLPDTDFRDASKSFQYYSKALEVEPNQIKDISNLGFLMLQVGHPQDSEKYFRRALDLNPRYALAYYGLGKAAEIQGDARKAEANYAEARRLDPNSPDH